jgi:phytoene dehydrogenase-like protein
LPLGNHGLEWIHSPAPLAHPFDDGTAVVLERGLHKAESSLGKDAEPWRRLLKPFVTHWDKLADEFLRPVHIFSRHPYLLARFGMAALPSAKTVARLFRYERTKALFAGIAAHSFLSLSEPLSSAFGVVLASAAHAGGWPIAAGGAQSITNALCSYLESLGGTIHTATRVENLEKMPKYDVTLCDVTPHQLLRMARSRLSTRYAKRLAKYRYGPGVFKVDYALSSPIPWKSPDCLRAATVHVGGSAQEIADAEHSVRHGKHAERPFVLLAQPSLFDSTRAPAGKHTAWAYCHVPNGSTVDMLPEFEAQIERFAPGFRDCVLARSVLTPADMHARNANLIGGDISGGILDMRQFLFRPTWRHYATSARGLYICSSSTPPGAGVHGMCGYHAAQRALARL